MALSATWEAAQDWSDAQNPNGVWSYNYGPGLPITRHMADSTWGGNPAWQIDNLPRIPAWLKVRNGSSDDSWPVGAVLMHSQGESSGWGFWPTTAANIAWTSPTNATVSITGCVWSAAVDAGRPHYWRLYHNSTLLSWGYLTNAGTFYGRSHAYQFALGAGGSTNLVRTVGVGDRIWLEIDRDRSKNKWGYFFGTDFAVRTYLAPDIEVECPPGVAVTNGCAVDCGTVAGSTNSARSVVIRNAQGEPLVVAAAETAGPAAGFVALATNGLPLRLAAGETATLALTLLPGATGERSAELRLLSNDPDENPFVVGLSWLALSCAQDSDGDGLSDAAEYGMSSLGFDWRTSQPALVGELMSNANCAGLYTAAQMYALNVGTPLIRRNTPGGDFTLTVGFEMSEDLVAFRPFPMAAPQASVNAQGRLEFRFPPPGRAAFFRLTAE